MALESQPTKSVPRRVRLAIERNIFAMSPDQNPQPRTQRDNLHLRSVETSRPLRGIALFDGKHDLTDADAQEATVRTCRSANPGIIILYVHRTASKSHLGFCMSLCTWQHERGALYIMILTDSDTFRGAVFGARNTPPERRECLARTGSQTNGDRGQIGHEPCPRVDHTTSFTVVAHIQQEAVAQRRVLPFAGDSDTWRSSQPRNAHCAEIARLGR